MSLSGFHGGIPIFDGTDQSFCPAQLDAAEIMPGGVKLRGVL